MNLPALLFFLITATALWSVPRKFAPLPLLVGCCYMTLGQGISLGGLNLPVFRMLLLVGLMRVFVKGETPGGGKNTIDRLLIFWALWVFFASFFHAFEPGSGPQYTAGVIFNICSVYFLFRCWTGDLDSVVVMIRFVGLILVPIAIEMAFEKTTGKNLFSIFGYVPENVLVREGRMRAQGPFGHAILAGTVGATCLPLLIGIWRKHRYSALLGCCTCLFIVFASASSGPIMSLLFGVGALSLWLWKPAVQMLRWAFVFIYIAAEIVMERPAYFLISKIDITGGSTGWHRSRLMEAFFDHFSEWAFAGTDFTRHWIPHGVPIGNGNHIDITNYYISFAVLGGLLSMLLVIAMLCIAFRWVGVIDRTETMPLNDRFLIWCLGAGLFGHAATSISVAYFDQSMIFFWLTIAVISSARSFAGESAEVAAQETNEMESSSCRPRPQQPGNLPW